LSKGTAFKRKSLDRERALFKTKEFPQKAPRSGFIRKESGRTPPRGSTKILHTFRGKRAKGKKNLLQFSIEKKSHGVGKERIFGKGGRARGKVEKDAEKKKWQEGGPRVCSFSPGLSPLEEPLSRPLNRRKKKID